MRGPGKKVSVKKLFTEYFTRKRPSLAKHALHYEPYGYASLKVWLDDGDIIVWDQTTNKIETIRKGWDR